MLKNEWKRLMLSPSFWGTLCIGCAIAIWHFFVYILPYDPVQFSVLPLNVYQNWMGAHLANLQAYWFFKIIPLLAVIPEAGQFFTELRNGYANTQVVRIGRKKYFRIKGIATFISGGMAVTIPLIVNFLLTAAKYPLLLPDTDIATGPDLICYGTALYYTHPMFYLIVYGLVIFLVSGCIALGAILLMFFFEFNTMGMLLPFIIWYAMFCFSLVAETDIVDPSVFLCPGLGMRSPVSVLIVAIGCGITICTYIWKARRYEA